MKKCFLQTMIKDFDESCKVTIQEDKDRGMWAVRFGGVSRFDPWFHYKADAQKYASFLRRVISSIKAYDDNDEGGVIAAAIVDGEELIVSTVKDEEMEYNFSKNVVKIPLIDGEWNNGESMVGDDFEGWICAVLDRIDHLIESQNKTKEPAKDNAEDSVKDSAKDSAKERVLVHSFSPGLCEIHTALGDSTEGCLGVQIYREPDGQYSIHTGTDVVFYTQDVRKAASLAGWIKRVFEEISVTEQSIEILTFCENDSAVVAVNNDENQFCFSVAEIENSEGHMATAHEINSVLDKMIVRAQKMITDQQNKATAPEVRHAIVYTETLEESSAIARNLKTEDQCTLLVKKDEKDRYFVDVLGSKEKVEPLYFEREGQAVDFCHDMMGCLNDAKIYKSGKLNAYLDAFGGSVYFSSPKQDDGDEIIFSGAQKEDASVAPASYVCYWINRYLIEPISHEIQARRKPAVATVPVRAGMGMSRAALGVTPKKKSLKIKLKQDASEASWRIAASQLTKLTADPISGLVARHLGPDDSMREKISEFIRTPAGKSLMAFLLSMALVPIDNEISAKLSRELRIKGMADGADVLVDLITEPLREITKNLLRGQPELRVDISEPVATVDAAENDFAKSTTISPGAVASRG